MKLQEQVTVNQNLESKMETLLQQETQKISSTLNTVETSLKNLQKLGSHRSCEEMRQLYPMLPSGIYDIDPDGSGAGDPPISVFCDIITGNP
jgi:hypothetical protein